MLDERDIRIAALEKENIELKKELNELRARYEQLSQNYEKLQHQLNELLRHRFGKKSERFTEESPESNDDNETDLSEDESKEEEEWVLYRRRKKNKNKRDIPRRAVIISVPEEQRQCACGCQKTFIRYEMKELYNYQPKSLNKSEKCLPVQKDVTGRL